MDAQPLPLELLEFGFVACKVAVTDNSGLMTSLLIAGFVGSASHCIGMCGPFVLSQVVARLEAVPARDLSEWRRLSGAALLPYHFGRMTTYGVLGAAAGGVASAFSHIADLKILSGVLLAVAALFFAGYALRKLGVMIPLFQQKTGFSGAMDRWLKPLFARPTGWRGYGLGLFLGFIPCGLLYGALAASASAGDWLTGGLAMVAFALGTVPALLGVGLAGHIVGSQWQSIVQKVAPVLLLINALALSYMAGRLLLS